MIEAKIRLTLEELYSIADQYPGAKAFDGVSKEKMLQFCLMFNEEAGAYYSGQKRIDDVVSIRKPVDK